jgi:hypothetical protein
MFVWYQEWGFPTGCINIRVFKDEISGWDQMFWLRGCSTFLLFRSCSYIHTNTHTLLKNTQYKSPILQYFGHVINCVYFILLKKSTQDMLSPCYWRPSAIPWLYPIYPKLWCGPVHEAVWIDCSLHCFTNEMPCARYSRQLSLLLSHASIFWLHKHNSSWQLCVTACLLFEVSFINCKQHKQAILSASQDFNYLYCVRHTPNSSSIYT